MCVVGQRRLWEAVKRERERENLWRTARRDSNCIPAITRLPLIPEQISLHQDLWGIGQATGHSLFILHRPAKHSRYIFWRRWFAEVRAALRRRRVTCRRWSRRWRGFCSCLILVFGKKAGVLQADNDLKHSTGSQLQKCVVGEMCLSKSSEKSITDE